VVEAYGLSDAGLVRASNEDCFLANEELRLFIVADGMGGHSAGEVASRLAVEAVDGFMRRTHGDTEFSWPYGIDPALSLDGNRLRTAIHLANRRVFRAAESRDDYTGMGTTVVGALVSDGRLVIASVGDSRLYLLQAGAFVQLTQDDSWVATILARDPQVDRAALAHHPMRHVLTSVLGAREEVQVHVSERALADGNLVLLCSDGLYGPVDEDSIRALLLEGGELPAIARRLVQAALDRGGPDNVTAVLIRYRKA
jgi:protein phosphatase